jgi:hypothetical protein
MSPRSVALFHFNTVLKWLIALKPVTHSIVRDPEGCPDQFVFSPSLTKMKGYVMLRNENFSRNG